MLYDILGRPRRVEGPRGLELKLERDGAGNTTRINDMQFNRRADGALTRVVDALGGTWGLLYDPARHPREIGRAHV